jgi:hypothetical protein
MRISLLVTESENTTTIAASKSSQFAQARQKVEPLGHY